MKTLSCINFALAAVFTVCCFYQVVFAVVRLLGKRRKFQACKLCRYAVLIAARNEQAVIGQLLDSIRKQDYPKDLVDVYVVADNCSDGTAKIAAAHGAVVYERQNKAQVGKGYALRFLLEKIREDRADRHYDGFFIFDADNLLAPNYITEMNKVFSSGNRVVTGYRNSKNFGDNWITAGYGLYFLRDSEYLNRPRDYLGVSCAVSGTGFLVADSLLAEGWQWFMLSEDMEFTTDMVLQGEKIAYCSDAVLYDEQPTSFRQSVVQRSRWIKGYFQVAGNYGASLFHTLKSNHSFACYDILMNTLPAAFLSVLTCFVNVAMFLVVILSARNELGFFLLSGALALLSSYLVLYLMGLMPLVTEWKRIHCPAGKKILYSFTFPVFIFSYVLAMLLAFFGPAEWKPIRHSVALSIGDMGSISGRKK